jgi:hypothetical protein
MVEAEVLLLRSIGVGEGRVEGLPRQPMDLHFCVLSTWRGADVSQTRTTSIGAASYKP